MRIIDADSLKNNIKKYRRYAADKDTWLIDRFIETVDDEESVPENFDKTSSDDYNKYKWHDLRKDSNDLPCEHHNYFPYVDDSSFSEVVLVLTGKGCCPIVAYMNLSLKLWVNPLEERTFEDLKLGEVIAWKYIEPFDEVHK